MRESTVKNYEELPLFLSAKLVSEVLGVSPSSAYELMHEKDFLKEAELKSPFDRIGEVKGIMEGYFS